MARKRRKSTPKPKHSWVEKIFSLKKILFYSLIIVTSLTFLKYNNLTTGNKSVEGTSDISYQLASKDKINAIAAANSKKKKPTQLFILNTFYDNNKDGRKSNQEACYGGALNPLGYVNGVQVSLDQYPIGLDNDGGEFQCDRGVQWLVFNKNCNTLDLKTLSGYLNNKDYVLSGVAYSKAKTQYFSDGNGTYGTDVPSDKVSFIKGQTKLNLCGTYFISIGLKPAVSSSPMPSSKPSPKPSPKGNCSTTKTPNGQFRPC